MCCTPASKPPSAVNPASGTSGLEETGNRARFRGEPRPAEPGQARLKAAAGRYFYPLPTPPLTAAAPGSVTRCSWAGARPGEAPAAAEIKVPLPKNSGPARRGLLVPGVASKEPGGAQPGSVHPFGDIFPLKMVVAGLASGSLREAQAGREAASPLLALTENCSSPLPP